jgi:chaperone modulatory protein CbpM
MKTIDEVLEMLDVALERKALEDYIERSWVRPVTKRKIVYFEEIDIARIRLVYQLKHDLLVNDEAMDVVLSLLDQVYGMRRDMKNLTHAIEQQPKEIQAEIFAIIKEHIDEK